MLQILKRRSLRLQMRQVLAKQVAPHSVSDVVVTKPNTTPPIWRSAGLLNLIGVQQGGIRAGRFSFFVCVVVTTVLAVIYLAAVAPKEYVAEARLVVRSAEKNSAISDALNMLSSLGLSHSVTQDAYVVVNYIKSRTIIEDVGGNSLLESIYARSNIGWFERLSDKASREDLWKYWQTKVSAVLDTSSSVITVNVRAFLPEDARRLAQLIAERSEMLVNEISERSRKDALMRAESELRNAEQRLSDAQTALNRFRNANNMIDPTSSAEAVGKLIANLTDAKIKVETELGTLRKVTSLDSPMQRILAGRLDNMNKQLADLQSQLTSETQKSTVANKIADYETLQLEVRYAEKLYAFVQAAYERARVDQERQQVYVVTIVKPTLPEDATYPRPFMNGLLVFIVCFVLWSAGALFVAASRDHAN